MQMQLQHHYGYDCDFTINLGESPALKNIQMLTLSDFNTLFQNNDINVLAQIFLNRKFNFNGLMYEYDRIFEAFRKNWSKPEVVAANRKQFDEVFSSITAIYARLFRELPERQAEVMAAYTDILTILDVVNYRLLTHSEEPIDPKPFLSQFTDNKVIQDAVFVESLTNLRGEYKKGSNTDFTNDIYESVFEKMAAAAGINKKALARAYKEADIMANGTQLDVINMLIEKF
ncbi:MAG: hypothetical protein IJ310_00525 [Clostridia bacterium]|nr:hypothetical protein [Clostridia bacterium]